MAMPEGRFGWTKYVDFSFVVPGTRTTDKAEGGGGALSRKESDAKKREDLTSLGSDDSGKCV